MTATRSEAQEQVAALDDEIWARLSLTRLLSGSARRSPERLAFASLPSAEPVTTLLGAEMSLAAADRMSARLAAVLGNVRLDPKAAVGILMPSGPEACIAILATIRAGFCPTLLPLGWDAPALALACEKAGVQALLTIGRLAGMRPADMARHIAARYFGLRFIAAFGDKVPDGVVALDEVLAETPDPMPAPAASSPGVITFSGSDRATPLLRSEASLVASALPFVQAAKLGAGQQIISLLAPDDLAGLACGLAAGLISGAPLTMQALFDSRPLADRLIGDPQALLVAPAWLEQPLAASGLLRDRRRRVVFVHQVPFRAEAAAQPGEAHVVDVLDIGEFALLCAARGGNGQPALMLGPQPGPVMNGQPLLDTRRGIGGHLEVRGGAAEIAPVGRFERPDGTTLADGWRRLPFLVDSVDARILAISEAAAPPAA
ncbi:MAG: AMP-binding protein [Pseudomonadota bacterium]|nr:MAG: hypothetical protein DIU59_05190 [Pseudomonadota bacterium]